MGIWAFVALVGLLAGALVASTFQGKMRGGIYLTMLVGAVSALAMAWIGGRIGIATQGTVVGFFVTVIGTAVILAVWRSVMGVRG
jgi:uncharacterized membrane protein YeaQ/YmgE (transglycosylase-associated protein family)